MMTVNYCLRRAARLHANCVAIDLPGGQITYRDFYQTVENSANKLAALGAAKGDRIAVLMQNSAEYLDLYYSVVLTGAIIVPLNTRWHINEIIFTLNDSGSKMLVVDERFASLVPQIRAAVPCLEHYVFVDGEDWETFAADFADGCADLIYLVPEKITKRKKSSSIKKRTEPIHEEKSSGVNS